MHKYCLIGLLAMILPAWSAEKKIKIQLDTSNLPAPLVHNFAHVALAMGVKEPLSVSKDAHGLIIQGNGKIRCMIQLNQQDNQALGVACR